MDRLTEKITETSYSGKSFFVFLLIVVSTVFSFSNAQNMFYHLLPGFNNPFVWVGLGGDANWTTPANWSTNSVPTVADTAVFDNTCLANCDPTINAAISIGGLNIKATYAGTIIQGAGNSISVAAGGWTQAAGTFIGSNASITVSGPTVGTGGTGGTFISTSNILEFRNAELLI